MLRLTGPKAKPRKYFTQIPTYNLGWKDESIDEKLKNRRIVPIVPTPGSKPWKWEDVERAYEAGKYIFDEVKNLTQGDKRKEGKDYPPLQVDIIKPPEKGEKYTAENFPSRRPIPVPTKPTTPTPNPTKPPKPSPGPVVATTPPVSTPVPFVNTTLDMPKKSMPKGSYAKARHSLGGKMVSAPVARTRRMTVKTHPKMSSIDRGVVITHSEFVNPLTVSGGPPTGFQIDRYTVNPGNSAAFPWLSNLAMNYDRYRFRYLRYTYISSQPTTTGGKVGIGYDYDSTDSAPADRREFYALTHHTETMPWDSCQLVIPVDKTAKFVNSHTLTDAKLLDCGQVFIMGDAVTVVGNTGDILVEYVVELLDPQQAGVSIFNAYANNPTVSLPFTTAFNINGCVTMIRGFTLTTNTIDMLDFPVGRYWFHTIVKDSAPATSPTLTFGYVGMSALAGNGYTEVNSACSTAIVSVGSTDNYLRITLGVTASWADCESVQILIAKLPPSYGYVAWG